MRLHSLTLHGYKRFLEPTKLLFNAKVTALTGLNEAGKSSVLSALSRLTHEEWLNGELNQRRRRGTKEILTAEFLLSAEQRQEYMSLHLQEPPRTARLVKSAPGGLHWSLRPEPRYGRAARDAAMRLLDDLCGTVADSAETLHPLMGAVLVTGNLPYQLLRDALKTNKPLQAAQEQLMYQLTDDATLYSLANLSPEARADAREVFLTLAAELAAQVDNVNSAAAEILSHQVPFIVAFDPVQDALPDVVTWKWNDATVDQRAAFSRLVALLRWGGVDGAGLRPLLEKGEHRQAASLITAAERGINARLHLDWPTSAVEVRLRLDGPSLTLDVVEQATAEHQELGVRSQGFQRFLALVAFVQRYQSSVEGVIVLIDEVETHLHVDAQRLVLQSLEHWPGQIQVVYTTHSPFALPSDLSAVREVRADRKTGTSIIHNHVWHNATSGLMGLYVKMGAATATTTAARGALVVEGETDFVVLPRMLAEALGEPLDALCLPGYAHAKKTPLIYEEAAVRVAYLFDGDAPGQRYRRQLLNCHVPEARVHTLPEGTELEDYLDPDLYCQAAQAVAIRWETTPLPMTPADLPGPDRHGQLKQLARAAERRVPTKQEVITEVLSLWAQRDQHLDQSRRESFEQIARALRAALTA